MSTPTASSAISQRTLANAIRALAMDAVEAAKSGHPGMPMGMADVATALYTKHLKFDASAPHWPDRDRFILSAGHGSMLLYALLNLNGYADFPLDQLKRFRQLDSRCAGHPEYGHGAGIETTTGPLGQGIANAVGFAIAERMMAARFGADLVDHRTWVIAGDGCLMEGLSQEAIALAGRHKLNKLIVLWDDNNISIDGAVTVADTTDQRARFEASGWLVLACDGHDADSIDKAMIAAKASADKPVMIACKTVIGYGAPKKAGTKSAHGEALGAEELAAAKAALGWNYGPFEIPAEVEAAWRAVGAKGHDARKAWEAKLATHAHKDSFESAISGKLSSAAQAALATHTAKMAAEMPKLASRASSGATLDAIFAHDLSLIGGSADLTGSVNTLVKGTTPFMPETPEGRYVHYGVREHGMAAAMNGMALHGGIIPYGGTFLVFADYMRHSLRLSALMNIRAIHVLTHDSIGLGEDGPTHQPVETLASLRAIPNYKVIRPCDAVEAAEAWAVALASTGPTGLVLSRQALMPVRNDASTNKVAEGAYELLPAEGGSAKVSLFATGSEVGIAVDARTALQAKGIPTRVVSCPCFELFAARPADEQAAVLGSAPVRIGIEAALRQGWDTFLRTDDGFVGMTGFGASGPAPKLYEHFGITAEAVTALAVKKLG